MRHTRTTSDLTPSRPLPIPIPHLLQVLNPRGLKSIPLPDLKLAASSLPAHVKSRVDYVLREYSMRYRAGTIPGEVFRRMLEEAGRTIERESPTRERSRPVARAKEVILRKRLKNLSQERLYITYDDSFKETLSTIADPPTEHEKKPVYVGHHRRASDHTEGRMEGSYVEMYNKREARQKEAVEAKNGVKAGKPSLASMRYDSEREIRVRSLSTADDHPPTGEGSDGNQGL